MIAPLLHVDEIDYDNAPEIPESDLMHDLLDGFQIDACDRVLEALAAGVAAGIDVDRDQSLSLIDHDIAARLEPNFALESAIDLGLHSVLVEDRVVLGVELDAMQHLGLNLLHEVHDFVI